MSRILQSFSMAACLTLTAYAVALADETNSPQITIIKSVGAAKVIACMNRLSVKLPEDLKFSPDQLSALPSNQMLSVEMQRFPQDHMPNLILNFDGLKGPVIVSETKTVFAKNGVNEPVDIKNVYANSLAISNDPSRTGEKTNDPARAQDIGTAAIDCTNDIVVSQLPSEPVAMAKNVPHAHRPLKAVKATIRLDSPSPDKAK